MADGTNPRVKIEGPADPYRPGPLMPPSGAGGGGKGGAKAARSVSGGSPPPATNFVDIPNDLRSTQTVKLIDLLSEGPISGLVNDPRSPNNLFFSVAFDGVRLANTNYSLNFNVSTWDIRYGVPGQGVLAGYPSAEAEIAVNLQVKTNTPQTRSITDADADRVRFTVSVPALTNTDSKSGTVSGSQVAFEFQVQANNGGWQSYGAYSITGKTTTKYQRNYTFGLPAGGAPWDIRVLRSTPDNTSGLIQNDTYWDSFSEIVDVPVSFNMSSVIAWQMDAAQFSTIPTRTYFLNGRIISVPSNYNPSTGAYNGAWDGSFQQAWTNNPAWILYDMLTNRRYGLGRYLDPAKIDKFKLYSIGQYCDGLVPDGAGGYQRRYTFNGAINTQQDAFSMISTLCSCFRGSAYWDGGIISFLADMPASPIALYTNANVINGDFTYAGADITARHNQILVKWQDQSNFGDERIAVAEDQDDISKHGIRPDNIDAQGCTSEGLALRYGKWQLYVESHEGETVSFVLGLNGVTCRPGDIIEIADRTKAGHRRGGRLIKGTTAAIVHLDAPADLIAGEAPVISCMVEDTSSAGAHIETVNLGVSVDGIAYPVSPAFSAAPGVGTVYVVSSGTLSPSLWRVTSIKEQNANTYDITAISHNPSKYAYIEQNIALSKPKISNFPILNITNLTVSDYLIQLSAISIGVRMLISWQSLATHFDVEVQPVGGITFKARVETSSYDMEAKEGQYRVRVTPISSLGVRGQFLEVIYTVQGKAALPADIAGFQLSTKGSTGFFSWLPATDLDVIIGGRFEMRFSPSSQATWNSATIILQSIPGTASTAELPYRPGTYFLKAVDSSGNYSKNAALLITAETESGFSTYYRFCESPDFLGLRVGTEVQTSNQWLVLGQTGGLWDDQTANMDTWQTVDVLAGGAPPPGEGYYYFDNIFDLGGVFSVRLTLDMLAFPLGAGDDFIDSRLDMIDTWADFDDEKQGVDGNVTVFIADTQDDPTSSSANWSAYESFVTGMYTARAFRFYSYLTAGPGQNVAIENLCVIADLENKTDTGNNIPYHGVKLHIAFAVKFYLQPSVVVTMQTPRPGDHMKISNKAREGFDIELFDTNNNPVPDGVITFDWHAIGY
jgi:predicted phage tail protein